jgi:NTP pyrophosphatase (non-canonical NTP hydrolase)
MNPKNVNFPATCLGLTFNALRAANLARLPLFQNGQGIAIHKEDGSDWSDSDWMLAVLGELGELANLLKKKKRGDFTPAQELEIQQKIAKEFADVQCYLDIAAYRCGVDLGAATVSKWNEVSKRVNCTLRISEFGQSVYFEDPI